MKKPKRVAPKADESEVRRWCVEQAMRWPMIGGYFQGNGAQQLGGMGAYGYVPPSEANILDRAERIRKWISVQT